MRRTHSRMLALKFAAGENDYFPTYAVATPLQRAGLIIWGGYMPGCGVMSKFNGGRGWTITEKGREKLRDWEENGQ